MKKSVIILLAAFCMILGTSAFAADRADTYSEDASPHVFSDSKGVALLHESLAVTQNDLSNNFLDYAEISATVSMPTALQSSLSAPNQNANVVGIVLDYDTELPVGGAAISINGTPVVSTGTDGRFQVFGVASGQYDWSISANGYCTASYTNYGVDAADGATIFTFYISTTASVVKNREISVAHTCGQTVPPDIVDCDTYGISAVSRAMSAVPDVSASVSVFYNGAVRSVNREVYIYTVISSELYGTGYYTDRGLTETETWQLYCAQAIAANTFLEYAQSVYSNHSNYEVCATSCCQNYDPSKVTQAAINAAADIFYTVNGAPATVVVFHKPNVSSYD